MNKNKNSENTSYLNSNTVKLNKQLLLLLTLLFGINFTLYLLTLAPTVTFEDSGELITAAYILGVPHQPGYPIFTILAKIFTLIPIGNIAFRVNMMSACCSSLASVFITYTLIIILKRNQNTTDQLLTNNKLREYFIFLASAFGGLLFAFSFENWEQSIITEVYGLNSLFTALMVLLFVKWQMAANNLTQTRLFMFIALFLGLGTCNHPTFLMFYPITAVFIFICDKNFLFNTKNILFGLLMLIIGLSPMLYLPIASATDPIIDWGNPENWTNFWRTITRHQYQLGDEQNLSKFSAQFSFFITELLPKQWIWPVLIFPIFGLIFIFKQNKKLFWLFVLLLIFTMPVTTWLTNFDINTGNKFIDEEHKELVSVFYIPAYMIIAALCSMGIWYFLIKVAKNKIKFAIILLFIAFLLPIITIIRNYPKVDMSKFRYAEYYTRNLFDNLPKNALLIGNYDVFVFPLFYYQYVEGQRTDIISIDQQLLRRSWYIHSLKMHAPELIKPAEKEVQEFLEAVAPFEARKPYNGNHIQAKYVQMIQAFIHNTIQKGHDVYLTYVPEKMYLGKYKLEPQLFAYKVIAETDTLKNIDFSRVNLTPFVHKPKYIDRTFEYVRNYYREQLLQRATLAERAGKKEMAKTLLNQALPMAKEQKILYLQIKEKLSQLQ